MPTSCKCFARCEADCVCDYDWTPPEITRLRHDIERHIKIASELATENERLTSALTDILNPLGRMQREAAANGCRLNGMAVQLMNDAQYLKEIAKEALATPAEKSKADRPDCRTCRRFDKTVGDCGFGREFCVGGNNYVPTHPLRLYERQAR